MATEGSLDGHLQFLRRMHPSTVHCANDVSRSQSSAAHVASRIELFNLHLSPFTHQPGPDPTPHDLF